MSVALQFPLVHPVYKLGKRMPLLDHRTLKATRYLKLKALPPAPTEIHWEKQVPSWPMLLNDQLGCCVPTAAGHDEQNWGGNAGSPFMPTNAQTLKAYEQAGGYNPNDPSTDQGMFLLDMLKYWKKVGFGGRQLAGYMSMSLPIGESQPSGQGQQTWPPKTQGSAKIWDELRQVVNLFGTAYIGLQLPLTAQDQVGTIWQVPKSGPVGSASPGSWGGHCIPIVGYLPHAAIGITWGAVQLISWAFLFYYMDESWAPLSPNWIDKATNLAPNAFNWKQLCADQQLVSLKAA